MYMGEIDELVLLCDVWDCGEVVRCLFKVQWLGLVEIGCMDPRYCFINLN